MTDKELLELAAKAAGVEFVPKNSIPHPVHGTFWGLWLKIKSEPYEGQRRYWNPLTDDGDEARLEAALTLQVNWYPACVLVGPEMCGPATGMAYAEYFDKHAGDKQAARRRAGVLAAAEIGKAMP